MVVMSSHTEGVERVGTHDWQLTKQDLLESLMEPEQYDVGSMQYAVLTSLRRDGAPFSIPLGYVFDGDDFYVSIRTGRSGIARLRRDPRVCLCFSNWTFPAKFITVTGIAEEVDDPGFVISRRINRRYPKEHVVSSMDEFEREWLAEGRSVFRIRPEVVRGRHFTRP
jgi:PPOX class probable F420-dependent enzyme